MRDEGKFGLYRVAGLAVKGVPVLVQKVSAGDVEALRSLGDQMRDKVGGVVVLADVIDSGKINILAMATKDAVAKGIHAGQIVKEVARVCGGGGGGRPDMAQAGGKDASKLDEDGMPCLVLDYRTPPKWLGY